jgi:hypothetical protein
VAHVVTHVVTHVVAHVVAHWIYLISQVYQAGWIGSFKFLVVCVAVWKVEDINRRTLLAVGTVIMALALLILSWGYWHYEEHPPLVLSISCMATISAAYSFS